MRNITFATPIEKRGSEERKGREKARMREQDTK